MPTATRMRSPLNTTPMLMHCSHCGEEFNTDDANPMLPNTCPNCIEADFTTCPECHTLVQSAHMMQIDDGTAMCRLCAQREAYRCQECNRWHRRGDHTRTIVASGHIVCANCLEHYHQCDCCHEWYREGSLSEDDNGDMLCHACFDRLCGDEIMSYSCKPAPIFHRYPYEKPNSLVMGVELEMDKGYPSAVAHRLRQIYEDTWIYFKHDSSLMDGVELVTHPISAEMMFSDERKRMWRTVCEVALDEEMRSHDTTTCGLHVHVNRDFFGKTQLSQDITELKLKTIIDTFFQQMTIFSRRRYNEIEQWAKKPDLPTTDDNWRIRANVARNMYRYDRYRAVNTTNNDTIEFRLFRGTLKPETILATLQFVSGLCHYARDHSVGQIEELNWYELCDNVIASCPEDVSELIDYLSEKELIVEETIRCA